MRNYWCPIENKFVRLFFERPDSWRTVLSSFVFIKVGFETYSHIPNKQFVVELSFFGFDFALEIDFQGEIDPYYKVWGERNV